MAISLDKLYEDLINPTLDVKLLALNTVVRLPLRGAQQNSQIIQKIFVSLKKYEHHDNSEVSFVAKKASEHLVNNIPQLAQKFSGPNQTVFDPNDLKSPQSETRLQCLNYMLAHDCKEGYFPILFMLVSEKDEKVISTAIIVLAKYGNKKTVHLLQVFLYFENNRIRANAVEAIETLGSSSDLLELLPPLINDENNRVRGNVLKALSSLGSSQVLKHIAKMLDSTRASIRSSAIYVLSQISGDGVIALLNRAAHDEFEPVRLQVVDALSKQQDMAVLPILQKLSQDIDIEVSEKAIEALNHLNEKKNSHIMALTNIDNYKQEEATEYSSSDEDDEEVSTKLSEDEFDDLLEKEMMKIGQIIVSHHQNGFIKEDKLLSNIYQINTIITQLEEKSIKFGDKNFVYSLKKALGGDFNEQIALQQLQYKLDDAFVDLGELAYELFTTGAFNHQDIEPRFRKCQTLFEQQQ
ncbi:MAG: HEAT repeat domain-containing protein [Candidatus Cloacimonetes bacterium]|nr:HEAT repeat domain-containing protein [Candidatus Cloacimonadota bacterium]